MLERLLEMVLGSLSFAERPEVTVEANPESVEEDVLAALAAIPGGRLSLGGQSFCNDVLRTLGRGHDPQAVFRAADLARAAGISGLSLDLIYGIPGQTIECWTGTLRSAAALKPDHVSCYCLSLEAGTRLERAVRDGAARPVLDSAQRQMYEIARRELAGAGYSHYEISNFATPGRESRHNMGYWCRGEYRGLGPSAHSFLNGVRWGNVNDVDEYCRRLSAGRDVLAWSETLSLDQAVDETVMLALRTAGGLRLDRVMELGGGEMEEALVRAAEPLLQEEVLALSGRTLTIPHEHWFVSDEIIARLLEGRRLFRRAPSEGGSKDSPAKPVS
jgi:oxygen-independent coproporphyrinogen-3 oxidase